MGIYSLLLLFLVPASDVATCNALLPLYAEHIGYRELSQREQWTDGEVASFFTEAPINVDARTFVDELASWLNSRTRYEVYTDCWRQWGNALDQPGHRVIAAQIYERELSALQQQGLADSVIERYFRIQDTWQFSDAPGIDIQYASALYNLGDYEAAIKELEVFLSQPSFTASHPEYANVLNLIGNVYYDLERYDEAEYFYSEAIATSQLPADKVYGARLNLASVYRMRDRSDEALGILQELLDEAIANERRIRELQIRINIGNALLVTGKRAEARVLYESVINQSRHYGVAKGKFFGFLNMVEWHFQVDQYQEAKPWIDSVFTMIPEVASHYEKVQAYKMLARFYEETGLTDESAFYTGVMADVEERTEMGQDVEAILADLYRISFNQVRQSVEVMKGDVKDGIPSGYGWLVLLALLVSIWMWVRRASKTVDNTGSAIEETGVSGSNTGPTHQDIVHVVLTAIRESPDYLEPDVLASDLVRSLGYPSRMIYEVMRLLGISSVASLVNRARVDHAVALMRAAPYMVSQDDIYRQVGFTSRRNYDRVFKGMMGVSPGEYLKRLNDSPDGSHEDGNEGVRLQ